MPTKTPDYGAILARAERFTSTRDLTSAAREYRQLLKYFPDDVLVLRKLSDVELKMGDTAAAVNTLTKLAAHYSDDGFFLKSIATWKRINKINPALLRTYEELAMLYERQELYGEAVQQLRALSDYHLAQGNRTAAEAFRDRANDLQALHSPRSTQQVVAVKFQPEAVLQAPAPPTVDMSTVPVVRTTNDMIVFLCHAHEDKPLVRELYSRLQADRFQPWLDEEELLPGQDWQIEISRAVRRSHAVVVCLSARSVNKAGYLQKEIKFPIDLLDEQTDGIYFIVPARLEPCEVPESL